MGIMGGTGEEEGGNGVQERGQGGGREGKGKGRGIALTVISKRPRLCRLCVMFQLNCFQTRSQAKSVA